MVAEYERSRPTVDRHREAVGAWLRILVGIIAVIAIAALISIAYFDRPPSSPSTARSDPNVTAPQRNMPQTPVPPATPSTK
jgi:hypothetical protein